MKRIIKNLINSFSRVIYYLIPVEIRRLLKEQSNQYSLIRNLEDEKNQETFEIFSKIQKESFRYEDLSATYTGKFQIQNFAINLALSNEEAKLNKEKFFYLEFGVFKGQSANFFSKKIEELYAFDSFFGLSEDWDGRSPKGTFSLDGKIPKLNHNVIPIIGKVEDTLEEFIKKHNPKINFIHLDMDIYGPTKFTLEKVKPYLISGAVILFDQLYNYVNWKEGEYKALKEIFEDSEYSFKAFNMDGRQVLIQLN